MGIASRRSREISDELSRTAGEDITFEAQKLENVCIQEATGHKRIVVRVRYE